jgi:hypothetical protein
MSKLEELAVMRVADLPTMPVSPRCPRHQTAGHPPATLVVEAVGVRHRRVRMQPPALLWKLNAGGGEVVGPTFQSATSVGSPAWRWPRDEHTRTRFGSPLNLDTVLAGKHEVDAESRA